MRRLETQRVYEGRQRCWLLASARIVKEIAGERLAPVFEHAHQLVPVVDETDGNEIPEA
jgi:hypothetical protein